MIWFRICVDVDHHGSVRGASFERRGDDGVEEISVLNHTVFGPFDTVAEVASAVEAVILRRHGYQRALLVVRAKEDGERSELL